MEEQGWLEMGPSFRRKWPFWDGNFNISCETREKFRSSGAILEILDVGEVMANLELRPELG